MSFQHLLCVDLEASGIPTPDKQQGISDEHLEEQQEGVGISNLRRNTLGCLTLWQPNSILIRI